jgi:hypothetical protein
VHAIDPRRRDEHLRWLESADIDVHDNRFELRDWADSHLYGDRNMETASARTKRWLCGKKSLRMPNREGSHSSGFSPG